MSHFGRAGAWLLDALLPPACVHCARPLAAPRPALCRDCRLTLRPLPQGCCRCALPWPGSPPDCGRCVAWPAGLSAVAGTRYAGAAESAVRALKYRGWRHLADPCADRIAAALAARGVRPDVLVPVPLHPTRRRERGFDQARLLAEALGRRLDRPVVDGLARIRPTRPQVGLGRAERAGNVAAAFAARRPVAGVVGLVDDVATSGATLSAAATPLLAHAEAVVAATFALALDPRAR